jgi:two-component system sensor histidine kinase KdpD
MQRTGGVTWVPDPGTGRSVGRELAEAFGGIALAAAVCVAFRRVLTTLDVIALFILAIVLISTRCRPGPAFLAALLGLGGFAFYFVRPWYTFAGPERSYLVAYGVLLAVPLAVGHLTVRVRTLARANRENDARGRALAESSRALTATTSRRQLVEAAAGHLGQLLTGEVTLRLVIRREGLLPIRWVDHNHDCPDVWVAAELALKHGEAAGWGTGHVGAAEVMVLPLRSAAGVIGAAVVRPEAPWRMLSESDLRTLELLADQIGANLDRILRSEPGDARSARMRTPPPIPDADEILMSQSRVLTPL